MRTTPPSRPRVEGRREAEIFAATLELIAESGYDRLTLDAVATRARASKATLYRRWSGKAQLVTDAIAGLACHDPVLPDTGSLSGDLHALVRAKEVLDPERAAVFCGLATAMYHDTELSRLVHERVSDQQGDALRAVLERGVRRGEVRADADLDLLCTVVQSAVLYKLTYVKPGALSMDFLDKVVDQVLVPACRVVPG